jgi:general stress protein YciG
MEKNTRNRGFASMDTDKQREIARKGGKAAHQRGTAHEFSTDEAREAGRKGGERVSHDRSHMAYIGRLGGKSSAARRRERGPSQPGETSREQEQQSSSQRPGEAGGEFRSAPEPSEQQMRSEEGGEEQEEQEGMAPRVPDESQQSHSPGHRP